MTSIVFDQTPLNRKTLQDTALLGQTYAPEFSRLFS
jgi:hypothetical protein